MKNKKEQRWLWHAVNHRAGIVLAYVFDRRKDEVFIQLKTLLEPFGIIRYFTDYLGTHQRHLPADQHYPGKRHAQQRKHLTLRTRMARSQNDLFFKDDSDARHRHRSVY